MTIVKVAAWLLSIVLVLVLLVYGKSYLMPIFVALVIWYLVNALNNLLRYPTFVKDWLPKGVTLGISLVLIGLALYSLGDAIVVTVNRFVSDSQKYAPRIDDQIMRVYGLFNMADEAPSLSDMRWDEQLWSYSIQLFSGLTNVARGFFLVLLYVLFFLIEQGVFIKKVAALGLDIGDSSNLSRVLTHINKAMRTYLGVKTFTSLLTALLSLIVLESINLDYALFWTLLIFLFNYVPTIGSITATVLPALLALVQFDSLTPFLVVAIGVTAIQIIVGNVLEPRLMGNTLNISPLVVVLSLILWSSIWGVIGMLLSVPITVAIIIICARFPASRPIAILLSKDGNVTRLGD